MNVLIRFRLIPCGPMADMRVAEGSTVKDVLLLFRQLWPEKWPERIEKYQAYLFRGDIDGELWSCEPTSNATLSTHMQADELLTLSKMICGGVARYINLDELAEKDA